MADGAVGYESISRSARRRAAPRNTIRLADKAASWASCDRQGDINGAMTAANIIETGVIIEIATAEGAAVSQISSAN